MRSGQHVFLKRSPCSGGIADFHLRLMKLVYAVAVAVLPLASRLPAQDQQAAEFQTSDQENLVLEESQFPTPAPPVPTDEELLEKFSTELGEADDAELLAILQPDGDFQQSIDAQNETISSTSFLVMSAVEFSGVMGERLERIESPYTQDLLAKAHGERRHEQLREELQKLQPGQLLTAVRPLLRTVAVRQREFDQDTTLLDYVRRERQDLQSDRFDAKRLYEFLNRLRSTWLEYVDTNEFGTEALSDQASAIQSLKELELKRLSAIREVSKRIKDGKLPADSLSESAEADQQVIIDEVQRQQDEHAAVQNAEQERQTRVEMMLVWRAWAELRVGHAEKRLDLINEALEHLSEAERSIDELDEFNRRTLEAKSRENHSSTITLYDTLMANLLEAEERSRFEDGLNFYYLEQEDTHRRLQHFDTAINAWTQLMEASTEYRNGMDGSVEDLQTALDIRTFEYAVARTMVAIANDPDSQQKFVEAFETQGFDAGSLPLDELVPGDVEPWLDGLVLAEARWLGQVQWVDDMRMLLSEVGLDAGISRLSGLMTDYETHREERDARRKAISTSITSLRKDFRARIKEVSYNNLSRLAVIPMVAFLLSFLVNRVSARVQRRAEAKDATSDRRIASLAGTAAGAVKSLIWLLAVVYMLKLAGLDVTPIVASASVLGLAVAFAAQTLVKDYFYGFVILWEGQFTEKEIVSINGIYGEVEKISLRSTQLRDFDGNLHYLPNGSIADVQNCMRDWAAVYTAVQVGYDTDVDEACRLIEEAAQDVRQDDQWKDILKGETQVYRVFSLDDHSMTLKIYQVTAPGRQWDVRCELLKHVAEKFQKAGIKMGSAERQWQFPG